MRKKVDWMIDEGIMLLLNKDGTADVYDDTWDITIHCTSEEEQKEAIKLLKKQMNSKWIPCSERMPDKTGKYLVTITQGGTVHTTVRRFNPNPKHPKQNEPLFTRRVPLYSGWERATHGVIAWMPLPEAYKEEVPE
jgi:hypothetical protein